MREAFVRHSKKPDAPASAEFKEVGCPLLEAQVADVVDSIAYDTHDVDDALGLGFLTLDDLQEVEFWQRAAAGVRKACPWTPGYWFRTSPAASCQNRTSVRSSSWMNPAPRASSTSWVS